MTEQELRALVREAISRHVAGATGSPGPARALAPNGRVLLDPAHAMFRLPEGADSGGPCLIEPSVMCNHCGYCKSYGH
jgi:hypothetical protein